MCLFRLNSLEYELRLFFFTHSIDLDFLFKCLQNGLQNSKFKHLTIKKHTCIFMFKIKPDYFPFQCWEKNQILTSPVPCSEFRLERLTSVGCMLDTPTQSPWRADSQCGDTAGETQTTDSLKQLFFSNLTIDSQIQTLQKATCMMDLLMKYYWSISWSAVIDMLCEEREII